MQNFDSYIKKYAELTVKVGLNIQKNQTLVINSPIECADFVRVVSSCAYDVGAKNVIVRWHDENLSLIKYLKAPKEAFSEFPKWEAEGLTTLAKENAAFLSISGSNPELFKDVDPEKISISNIAKRTALRKYSDYVMNSFVAWCVVSVPTKDWAKKIFPNCSEEDAMEKLWEILFKIVRVDKEDPVLAWENHLKDLETKVNFLNKSNFKKLYYKSKDTNLIVELPKDHIWCGGGEYNAKKTFFVANIPTEEIFTLPLKNGVNGVVKSTKPLNFGGNLIEDFSLTFQDGKIIDFHAKTGYETLKKLITADEGSSYLGEVALVPYSSPISKSNVIFFNTLLDENASCHLAFGKAYPTCIKNGENMTKEELINAGVNDSLNHEDFMIGSHDLDIIGETYSGNQINIFKNGEWAF